MWRQMFLFAALLNLALLTSDSIPEAHKPDDQLLINALRDYDIEAQSVDWRAQDRVWSDFDAALIYSTWDYYEDHARFLDLLRKMEDAGLQVYNSPSIVQWNSCKKYLQDLERWGLKTIETVYISPAELENLESILIEKGWKDCVIKPQISADGHHTYRFNLSNIEHIQNTLKNFDEQFMIQPFAEEVMSEGEWSFVFFGKEYIHCILRKTPEDQFRVQGGKRIPIQPPDWMLREAEHILEIINLPALQTRVDLIRRGDEIRIMEIELIEPSLYLKFFPGSEKIIAKKISEKLKTDFAETL
jgi:glutathione synthase/RimK-type ligase-like ATP-grasp enzyme